MEGSGSKTGSIPLTSVADPDPGLGAFLTPRSGTNNPDHIFYMDGDSSDPGSRMEKSRIRDKHPGSTTLPLTNGSQHLEKVRTLNYLYGSDYKYFLAHVKKNLGVLCHLCWHLENSKIRNRVFSCTDPLLSRSTLIEMYSREC